MCFFGVYRIIESVSESYAHAYRAGQGDRRSDRFCKVFPDSRCGNICRVYSGDEYCSDNGICKRKDTVSQAVFHIHNAGGTDRYRRHETCRQPTRAYALSTGWLSVGSLVTFAGLIINMPKAKD